MVYVGHTFAFSFRRLSVPNSHLNCCPQTFLRLIFTNTVNGEHLQPTVMQSNSRVSFAKNICHSIFIPSSILRLHFARALQFTVNAGNSSQDGGQLQQQVREFPFQDQILGKETQVDSSFESTVTFDSEDSKETERRRKIGVANKGRIPWNKGRKHSAGKVI